MSRIITCIKEKRGSELLTVTVKTEENGKEKLKSYEVSREDFEAIGSPKAGAPLEKEEFSVISFKTDCKLAFERALKILSLSDNSARALERKLIERGFSREASEYAVARIIGLGYINEENQLLRLIEFNVNSKLCGRKKLIKYLMQRGYSYSDITKAIERAEDEEIIDFESVKEELKKKYSPKTSEELRKLLYKHGF